MMSFILNLFLFLLGLGIGVKYERWVRDKSNAAHSRFQETGFQDSRYQKSASFKPSTNATARKGPPSKKGNSRFHIS